MQALIDFDGWRKWKDFSSTDTAEKAKAASKSPVLGGVTNADLAARAKDKKAKRDNRTSLEATASTIKKDEPPLETVESGDA